MAYMLLGSRTETGVIDQQQINPFNPGTGWDVLFTPAVLATNLTQFEVYQISVDGPVGFGLVVQINGQLWNSVNQGWKNSWDPSQPMILRQTDEIDFLFQAPFTPPPYDQVSNIQPVVTLWLRYDLTLGGQ